MEWAGFHRRAMSPEPRERLGFLADLAQRIGFDPAQIFAKPQATPQLSEKDAADPAIRYFADHLGRLTSDQQAMRAEMQRLAASERRAVETAESQALEATRWGIDSFADEKDQQGNLLRPDFDRVLPHIIKLYRADPNTDMREAYETARWMDKQNRESLLTQERGKVASQNGVERARAAVRGNTRGLTAPVSKQSPQAEHKGLRGVLEKSADEVGF